ncbi:MAG: hypothetical protein DWH91_16395 [Planctomycetota bacterium]|nr:MAG: hypothetical protein DWH91_16395 [Planctomycetota bacterium]
MAIAGFAILSSGEDFMARGDHLMVPLVCGTTHHGIDLGDGSIIHWSGIWRNADDRACDGLIAKQYGTIRQEPYELFARDLPVTIQPYQTGFEPDEVVQRALSRIGERGYHLTENNCEHFAVWCKIGKHHSAQVWAIHRVVRRTASAAVRIFAGRGSRVLARGVTRGASPWLLVADGAQLATELAAVHRYPHAPEAAEKLGARVGLATSVGVGAVAGMWAGPVGMVTGAVAGAGSWYAGEKARQKATEWIGR